MGRPKGFKNKPKALEPEVTTELVKPDSTGNAPAKKRLGRPKQKKDVAPVEALPIYDLKKLALGEIDYYEAKPEKPAKRSERTPLIDRPNRSEDEAPVEIPKDATFSKKGTGIEEKKHGSKRPKVISYSDIGAKLWHAMLTVLPDTPHIPPPTIRVDWTGTGKKRSAAVDFRKTLDRYVEVARCDIEYMHYAESMVITPVRNEILVHHQELLAQIGRKDRWNGQMPLIMRRLLLEHILIHEYYHYITAYRLWIRIYNEERFSDRMLAYEEFLRYVGDVSDPKRNFCIERDNEDLALQMLVNIVNHRTGYGVKIMDGFQRLDILADGPYMKWIRKKYPKYSQYEDSLNYFWLENQLMYHEDLYDSRMQSMFSTEMDRIIAKQIKIQNSEKYLFQYKD